MPVEVHDTFLQPQQVIDGADDHVDSRGVTSLRTEVVLPFCKQQVYETNVRF